MTKKDKRGQKRTKRSERINSLGGAVAAPSRGLDLGIVLAGCWPGAGRVLVGLPQVDQTCIPLDRRIDYSGWPRLVRNGLCSGRWNLDPGICNQGNNNKRALWPKTREVDIGTTIPWRDVPWRALFTILCMHMALQQEYKKAKMQKYKNTKTQKYKNKYGCHTTAVPRGQRRMRCKVRAWDKVQIMGCLVFPQPWRERRRCCQAPRVYRHRPTQIARDQRQIRRLRRRGRAGKVPSAERLQSCPRESAMDQGRLGRPELTT